MNHQTIQWNGHFTTYPLQEIAGKALDLLPFEREERIRRNRRAVRGRTEQLLQHPDPSLLDANELLHYPVTAQIHKGYGVTTVDAKRETAYGYVINGTAEIFQNDTSLGDVGAGKFFALNGFIDISGKSEDATIVVITRKGYQRTDDLGDAAKQPPMEYVNGCKDVSLTSPDQDGAPCTNMLFVNPGTTQDAHIHPSDRIGVIIEGSAICSIYDDSNTAQPSAERWTEKQMRKGDLFLLPAGKLHRFTTTNEPLTVFTFHPENDETENPMMHGTIRNTDEAQRWRERFSGT